MKLSKKVFILLALCLLFSWLLTGSSSVMAQERVTKFTLTLDKAKSAITPASDSFDSKGMVDKSSGITPEKPQESIGDLINMKSIPIMDVAAMAKNGGKELATEIKTFMANGYNFYVVELGVNLGPSRYYKFIEANLTYQLLSKGSDVKVFDIFPQTTYDEILKISSKVGLDLNLGYKVPGPVPAGAELKANFLIEPKPWVWRVATIQSTGKYTSKAGWIFKVGERSADLQTRMILMSKEKPPFSVIVNGWIEISPGALHQNYYYNIDSANVELSE